MNKEQKEVQQVFLNNEKAVLKQLEKNYEDALAEINSKIAQLLGRNDADMQHVIYQVEYQKAMKKQVQAILEQLQTNEFQTVSQYLTQSYEDGFIGAMYDIAGQGIPMIIPIDQEQVVAAIQHETKLSTNLYKAFDIKELQKQIAHEISRGIAGSLSFAEISRSIAGYAGIGLNKAMRIARTEAHRIQCKAAYDAQKKAKSRGADVVKQWDASLDSRTRKNHAKLDGQIRELDEPFEVGGRKAMHPSDFGRPEEDINCRCALLQRARWALDESELETLKQRAESFGLDKTKDFDDFKKKYLKAQASESVRQGAQMMNDKGTSQEQALEKIGKSSTIKTKIFTEADKLNDFFYYDVPSQKGLLARKNSTYGKWKQNLTSEQVSAMAWYTGDGYGDINDYWRKVDGWEYIDANNVKDASEKLDSLIAGFELKENIVVQRGVSENSLYRLLDKYKIEDDIQGLVGKKLTDAGYGSSTALYGNNVATSKPVMYEITVPSGKGRGAYINEFAGQFKDAEYEFLFKRDFSGTITEVVEDETTGKVIVKVVMDVE